MPVNSELVQRKITLILEDLDQLRQLAALTLEDYLADQRNEVLAERYLERIIGRVIDINFHVVTEESLITPKDYSESFIRLGGIGILDRSKAEHFAKLAGLRNLLAHEYNGIDVRLIHQSIQEIVAELPEYLKAIQKSVS